jgi:hypothetical protein
MLDVLASFFQPAGGLAQDGHVDRAEILDPCFLRSEWLLDHDFLKNTRENNANSLIEKGMP